VVVVLGIIKYGTPLVYIPLHTIGMHTMVLQWYAYHGITMVCIQLHAYHLYVIFRVLVVVFLWILKYGIPLVCIPLHTMVS
jgi:hypothetical protein